MAIRIVDGRNPGMYEKESLDEEPIGVKWSKLRNLTRSNYWGLPKVTLSALTETGKAESTIPVPNQRSYTGTMPVIPSALAETPCLDLGMGGVLKMLNATLNTSYTLENPILPSIFESFIRQDYDFGTLYANLRPYWYDLTTVERIRQAWNEDREMRQNKITNNRITDGNIPPRRVWDLYANRVVPYWLTSGYLWAISHAWVSDEERMDVWTPINGYEWPVPIPKDVDLNLIRIEMLKIGGQYVWLDVLCLRQEGGKREDLRREEWKVDVPTIGSIYHHDIQMVVYYFSGLGRPFCFKLGDLESDRCWFRRAWTLQEVNSDYIIGGETGNYSMNENLQRFDKQLRSLEGLRRRSVLDILQRMRNRVSTKPLDKVAGLVYILSTSSIPIYDETQSEEDAWGSLVDVMDQRYRMDLLFLYPEPGDGRRRWQPSWNQVMAMAIIRDTRIRLRTAGHWTEGMGADSYEGPCIKSGNLRGLGEVANQDVPRPGELVVMDSTGVPWKFKILADHAYPIPDGSYILIGSDSFPDEMSEHWVVGRQRWDGTFEKISVIRIPDPAQYWDPAQLYVAKVNIKTYLC